MNLTEFFLIMLLQGVLCICSFTIGARTGQKIIKNEEIRSPNLNLVKIISNSIQEHKQKEEKEKEDEYYKTIMHNIDTYDGTSNGQMNIPQR